MSNLTTIKNTNGVFLHTRESGSIYLSLSNIIVVLIVIMSAMPFGNLWFLRTGLIQLNLYELIYVVLIALLLLHMSSTGLRKEYSFPLILTIILFITYGYVSLNYTDVNFADVFRQSRLYAPFFVAVLIIASRISFDIEVFAKAIVVAALISSMSALVIHFAFPQLIEQSFQASEDVIYISTEGGRMTWENSCLVFIVSAIFFAAPRRSVMIWLSLSVCVIALGATTSRTQLVSLAVFGILLNVLWTDSAIKRIKKMVISVIVVVAISLLIYFTFSHDSRFRQYVDIGLLGQGDMSNVYETSVEVNRLFLYEQYWDRIVNSFPYGQGLGHPVANNGVQDVYIADISIVAFLIPFGLTGVLLFIVFIKNIFKLIRNSYSDSYFKKHLRESFSVMIVIWIVISLNDDWISRKISVIYMAIISVLLFSGEHRRLVGPK